MKKLWNHCTQKCLAVMTQTAIVLAFSGVSALAQTAGAGSINGTVSDVGQAVIPGASVSVINTDTNVAHDYTTNASGLYTAPFLLPGHYKVAATAANFGKVEASNITLNVGQSLTVDLTLKVSAESTTVEVAATNQILDLQKTEVSQVVDQHLIQNMPVNARNWSDFVLLTPNVVQDGGSGMVSFHGISGLYNQNYVDGANNNQMLFCEARGRASGAPYVYSLDSIKEFQAETGNYSVEFGQAAGGQVNAITKSGTSNMHGDLFYYLRYPSFNALDPYNKYQALHNNGNPFLLTQPIHQQQQFGGSVGGPLIKNRLFYFLTYDGFRKVGSVLYSTTNTFSLTPSGAYNATSTITPSQCPTLTAYTAPSTNPTAYISAAQCTAGITFLMNTANIASGQAPPSRFAKQNLFFPRLDYHFNDRTTPSLTSTGLISTAPTAIAPQTPFPTARPAPTRQPSYHERYLVAGWTTLLSPTMVNNVHGQWGRDLETAGANAPGPSIAMGAFTYGMPNALPRVAEPDEHRIQITDVFSTHDGKAHRSNLVETSTCSRGDDQSFPGRRHLWLRRFQ